MLEPNIVLIPIEYLNSREKAEEIEKQNYRTTTALRIQLAMELIRPSDPEVENGTEPKESDIEDVLIYPLTDFMDECNDQEINIENYFISYVFFEK